MEFAIIVWWVGLVLLFAASSVGLTNFIIAIGIGFAVKFGLERLLVWHTDMITGTEIEHAKKRMLATEDKNEQKRLREIIAEQMAARDELRWGHKQVATITGWGCFDIPIAGVAMLVTLVAGLVTNSVKRLFST